MKDPFALSELESATQIRLGWVVVLVFFKILCADVTFVEERAVDVLREMEVYICYVIVADTLMIVCVHRLFLGLCLETFRYKSCLLMNPPPTPSAFLLGNSVGVIKTGTSPRQREWNQRTVYNTV